MTQAQRNEQRDFDRDLQRVLDVAALVEIVSGEGERGTAEVYRGRRTVRALKTRLTRERGGVGGGDRWAYVRFDGRQF